VFSAFRYRNLPVSGLCTVSLFIYFIYYEEEYLQYTFFTPFIQYPSRKIIENERIYTLDQKNRIGVSDTRVVDPD
jgi:hypothetical protein